MGVILFNPVIISRMAALASMYLYGDGVGGGFHVLIQEVDARMSRLCPSILDIFYV